MKKFAILLVSGLLVSGCSGAAATPSAVVPTATSLPLPTFTPTVTLPPAVLSGFPYAPLLNEELPKDGLVLAMHRYADNTCYDVGIYQDDSYIVISCLPDYEYAIPAGTLDGHASMYLHRWIERYQGYEIASAQGLLTFSGKGSLTPEDAEQISMEALLRELELLAHDYVVPFDGMSQAVIVAGRLLEQRLGRPLDPMNVRIVEQVEFSDSCLGLPRQDEICAQAVTPGMKIGIVVDDLMYVFHTDAHGFDLRLNTEPVPAPTPLRG